MVDKVPDMDWDWVTKRIRERCKIPGHNDYYCNLENLRLGHYKPKTTAAIPGFWQKADFASTLPVIPIAHGV